MTRAGAHPRILALAAVLSVGGFSVAACGDLIAGDHDDVTAQLCKQLSDCYGDAEFPCAGMEATFRSASAEVRDDFLSAFNREDCLDSCPRSLACLDREPYCQKGGACTDEHDCCNWSLGLSACGGDDSRCCAPRGVACQGDDDCCDAACDRGFCGGFACTTVGQPCERAESCCTRRCEEGTCAAKLCSNLGDPCKSDDDCCNPPNGGPVTVASEPPVAGCEQGTCVLKLGGECAPAGSPCNPTAAPETGACCGACVAGIDDLGICSDVEGCFGPGLDCSFDGQCCADLVCDYSLGEPMCASKPFAECGKAGDACMSDGDCCAGRLCSNESTCTEVQAPECTATSFCHSPCEVGAAMLPGSCADMGPAGQCVDDIILADSFCGCIAWDFLCAEEAKNHCLAACF
ncbi:MAG: hypothetical protein HOV80_28335 [Polyangiaceae bacterium]|nr:hypothetical protein [Polyangiaceae bacterium]